MTKNNSIETLIEELDHYSKNIDDKNLTINESLDLYKKAIQTSKKLIKSLDAKQKTFETLNKETNDLLQQN